MLTIYSESEKEKWNKEVKSYQNWDVYYLYEYAYSFRIHGDGEPHLICYRDKESRFCIVVMKKDISNDRNFIGIIPGDKYYDLETPYGYGGPLSDSIITTDSQKKFNKELTEYCKEKNIISLFIRFDTLLSNQEELCDITEIRYMHDTVYIDTSSEELIMKNMDSKCRNMVRKAEKNGISIVRKSISDIQEFIPIYDVTMKNNGADEYYFFEDDYYASMEQMSDNACVYYAYYNGNPISSAIMLYNDRYMHYHLSGTLPEYRKLSPGNLLLYTAARDAARAGIERFHLGGGMSDGDSLFGFKKQFNRDGRIPFYIGKMVFDNDKYKELLKIRKSHDMNFDEDNNYMIKYRK